MRWGWIPGERAPRPVYAPAMVTFVGGGGGPVGWFPLGPRDVYCPPYHTSRNYFTSVNVTNVRNVYVNRTVINNYYTNVVVNNNTSNVNYTYRNMPNAATVVSRDTFVGAKPVQSGQQRFDAGRFSSAPLSFHSPAVPSAQSLAAGPAAARPPAEVFQHPVVAHAFPPPSAPSFAVRQNLIRQSGGAPVSTSQLHMLGATQSPPNAHFNVVGGGDAAHALSPGEHLLARPMPKPGLVVPPQSLQPSTPREGPAIRSFGDRASEQTRDFQPAPAPASPAPQPQREFPQRSQPSVQNAPQPAGASGAAQRPQTPVPALRTEPQLRPQFRAQQAEPIPQPSPQAREPVPQAPRPAPAPRPQAPSPPHPQSPPPPRRDPLH